MSNFLFASSRQHVAHQAIHLPFVTTRANFAYNSDARTLLSTVGLVLDNSSCRVDSSLTAADHSSRSLLDLPDTQRKSRRR
jgi:hypothetical protein